MDSSWKKVAEDLLQNADIEINGKRPWDIQVHNNGFFERVFKHYSLGLGESYMEGWWDSEQIDEFIKRILEAKIDELILRNRRLFLTLLWLKARTWHAEIINAQSERRALVVGRAHYDIGNDLYQHMLGKNLNYTCG